jgi:hypothetical protein
MFVTKFLYENGRHKGMSLYLHSREEYNFFFLRYLCKILENSFLWGQI